MKRTKKPAKPFKPVGLEGKEIVDSPSPSSVVLHSGWSPRGPMKGYPCDVYIVNGAFEVNGRLSNWWTWRRIIKTKNGDVSLGPEESGYGAFRVCENKYDIKVLIKREKK